MAAAKTNRACAECHSAKVKCVKMVSKIDGSDTCVRCERLGLKYAEHVSRQGQGKRRQRQKRMKTKKEEKGSDSNAAAAALCPTPCCPTSSGASASADPVVVAAPVCSGGLAVLGSSNGRIKSSDDGISSEMQGLQIEDNIVCASLSQGIDKDHYGINCLIRGWVALSFSRRSFSLLARASFIADRLGISMDEILANRSPFAAVTDSQPMDFLARDMLLPKGQRKTVGFPIFIDEVPWDVLRAVQIDPARLDESVRNRWFCIRWTTQGTTQYWTSPLFSRDFASVEEINRVYSENRMDRDVVDLWVPKSDKALLGQDFFNHLFLHKKPNMPLFVTKTRCGVCKRNSSEVTEVDIITTVKLADLDSLIHYHEIQFLSGTPDRLFGNVAASGVNKRDINDVSNDHFDDPILDDTILDDIEFTDLVKTDEMEGFLKLLGGDQNADSSPAMFA